MQTRNNARSGQGNRRIAATHVNVDVNGNGHKTAISAQSLHGAKFTDYHGTVDGREVKSIRGIPQGESMILLNGKSGMMAGTKDELRVFAKTFLESEGHTVQLKAGTEITTS
ncbi:MAG: hypothetical protein K9M10_03710 [Candidatus Pacebacteria bacterium]|nr:hypothetical protein [Candidatus Paceibacterota bacterium]MCF7857558.1 hypothetical protein [Candidatus Paceibacterota bacterium]